MQPEDRLIVAIDKPSAAEALALIDELQGVVRWIKVGLALFAQTGPELVKRLTGEGWRVFLDLKLHDVPHQVALAVGAVADLGASLLTVHTSGGQKMLEAAAETAAGTSMGILGVTVLTSLDQTLIEGVGVNCEISKLVPLRARLAHAAGLAGVVCSPLEARLMSSSAPEGFEIVTPGIRPPTVASHDQKRVATPQAAIANGATRLVVGRAITTAPDPASAASAILDSIR